MTTTAWSTPSRSPIAWERITSIVTGDLETWAEATSLWGFSPEQWQYFGQTVVITGLPTPVDWNVVPR